MTGLAFGLRIVVSNQCVGDLSDMSRITNVLRQNVTAYVGLRLANNRQALSEIVVREIAK
jgi:hypothetical protein